jgi:AcrR family transcriptional regulator
MTEPPLGRRERKKAATRAKIADTALQLFLEHGYESVGIRDVAAAADVAVTTVFSHFASKEALVFEQDQDFELRLVRAVTHRSPDEPLMRVLRREIQALIRHCTAEDAAPFWRMIDESAALQDYEKSMRLRHAEARGAAIQADRDTPQSAIACRTIARFVIDAFTVGREAADPKAAVDEIFEMVEAAWESARTDQRA